MSTASLFDLSDDARRLAQRVEALAEHLDSDDAETAAEVARGLERLLDDSDSTMEAMKAKADAYCWVIEKLRATAAARDSKAAALQRLARADTRQADALQERLVACLQRVFPEARAFDLPHHVLYSKLTTAVEVDADAELASWPEDCLRTKVEPDKTAAKALLAIDPKALPGARLVQRRSWRIS